MPGFFTTGFQESGVDIGDISKGLVEKSYLMDVYPGLIPTFAAPGLWLWGANGSGQLGTNNTTDRSSPVQTITASSNWKQVSVGNSWTAAIKTDGTLWLWGTNSNGVLGDNTVVSKSSPVQTVTGGTNWKQVSCGSSHTGAIKTDGTLWMWGQNNIGQLGDSTTTNKSSPVQIFGAGVAVWKQVSCGRIHTAAIRTDGTLVLWGFNQYGQLGDNTVTARSAPVATVSGGNNWKQVSAGSGTTAAIKTDGTLWTWGEGTDGQLGDGSGIARRSSPNQTIAGGTNWKQVHVSSSADINGAQTHVAAIKTDGSLWLWGKNESGQLGDNSITSRSSPVQTVAGGTNWKYVSASGQNAGTTVAIKTDGTLWTWGNNSSGQLGDNTIVRKSSPVQTVAGGTYWKQVAIANQTTSAIGEFGDW